MQPAQKVLNPTQVSLPTETSDCAAAEQDRNYRILSRQPAFDYSFDFFQPASEADSKIQKARAILGDIALDLSDGDLSVCLTQFQYLVDEWLDEYEKQVFNGLTLQQVLREG